MTAKTSPTTAAVEQAREELERAQAAHADARAASEAARAALAELEQAADRGEEVDVDEYNRRKADLGLKARRTSALAGPVAQAQQALRDAEKADRLELVRRKAKALPDLDKAREKVVKALADYWGTVDARDAAVSDLYAAADDLPEYAVRPDEILDTGWPCYSRMGRNGWVLEGRHGQLRLDGRPIERPDRTSLAKHLGDLIESSRRR